MGLAPGALEGRDVQQLATQVGALARAAVTVLRQLLDQQAQGRRQLGSRAPALQAVRDANPLRLAATPEAALLALLAPAANPEAPLQRTAAELLAHQGRVMAAFRSAAERMGKDMAPGSLEAVLPGDADSEQAARLWQLYTQLWQGMGMAPDQPWSAGFVEAALMHLSAAYDEQVQA
jgi:predicted component of type VI protein secretion system